MISKKPQIMKVKRSGVTTGIDKKINFFNSEKIQIPFVSIEFEFSQIKFLSSEF